MVVMVDTCLRIRCRPRAGRWSDTPACPLSGHTAHAERMLINALGITRSISYRATRGWRWRSRLYAARTPSPPSFLAASSNAPMAASRCSMAPRRAHVSSKYQFLTSPPTCSLVAFQGAQGLRQSRRHSLKGRSLKGRLLRNLPDLNMKPALEPWTRRQRYSK
jgi:hypothetical protein